MLTESAAVALADVATDGDDGGPGWLRPLELHDCFTTAELKFVRSARHHRRRPRPPGRRWGLGVPKREIPVNVSGGPKSQSHPVGATGVSQHVLAAMQLTGTAGALQLLHSDTGAVHNMGELAIANDVRAVSSCCRNTAVIC